MRIKRKYVVGFIVIAVLAALFLWGRSYVLDHLAVNLNKRIQSIKISGFNVRYDSIYVDWMRSTIEVDKVILEKNAYDTTCIYPEYISVGKVTGQGIGLYALVFNKILALDAIYLDSPRVVLRENSLFRMDSTSQRENEFTLRADRVVIRAADWIYTDSVSCNIITGLKSDISIRDLNLDFHIGKPLSYRAAAVTIDSAEIRMPRQLYTFHILQASLNFDHNSFRADSIRVVPDVGKVQFGNHHGFEIDRFDCVIPFVRLDGLSFPSVDSAAVTASAMEIQFYLKVFRDKRLPFRTKKKFLPQDQLQRLPFALVIDTLEVKKSYVMYEEYAEGASEPGQIFFDNLYATFHNITNTETTGTTEFDARSNLLGHGELNLHVSIPRDNKKRTRLSGSIENFSIPEINSMLTPTTQIKVESGDLKELRFDFSYNSVRSDGELELTYENLKLISFKDDPKTDGEPEKDNLKTFIMNTFIFRKNMHEDLPADKRKGTIEYLRDDSRSVFNFWSKSLVSGIKSAYKLDKVEARTVENDVKKEERMTRREARKLKRAAKKKERG